MWLSGMSGHVFLGNSSFGQKGWSAWPGLQVPGFAQIFHTRVWEHVCHQSVCGCPQRLDTKLVLVTYGSGWLWKGKRWLVYCCAFLCFNTCMLALSLCWCFSERGLISNRAGMEKRVRNISVLGRMWSLRSGNKNVRCRMNVWGEQGAQRR